MAHVDIIYSELGSITYRMYIHTHLIFPSDSLHPQELFNSRTAIEAAETAHLGAAMGKIRLIVNGHTVDMDGTIILRQQ